MNTSTFSTGSGGGGGGGNQYIRSLASSVGLAGDPLLNMKISAHGEPIEITLKVVMIGDGAVGKTQIARIFTMNGYVNRSGNYQETLGCDVYSKILSLPGKYSS